MCCESGAWRATVGGGRELYLYGIKNDAEIEAPQQRLDVCLVLFPILVIHQHLKNVRDPFA